MPIYNFFKNLFGIPDGGDSSNYYGNQRSNHYNNQERKNQIWEETEEGDTPNRSYNSFPIYTDPLEIHRYFEQQMDEILRSFSGFFSSDESTQIGGLDEFEGLLYPNQPNYPQIEPHKKNLRAHYLKPGYEQPTTRTSERPLDSDLDGKIDAGNLDSILGNKRTQITPYSQNPSSSPSFFGQTVTSRRIQKPDGSVEIHKTIRDSQGNEETTVTRQIDDKEYTITTRKNKDGKEEKIEDMVNIDEKDISIFLNLWQTNQSPQEDPNKYFPFDKFFK